MSEQNSFARFPGHVRPCQHGDARGAVAALAKLGRASPAHDYSPAMARKRQSGQRKPPATPAKKLDLAQFASHEDAFAKVEPGDRYRRVGEVAVGAELTMAMPTLFWLSMLSRAEGLHQAIAREIRAGNPHAVLPLIRAFAETVTLLIYVVDHPGHAEVVGSRPSELPKGGPKRKSMQALINYASKHAPGMKTVYAELSEATHFGALAMWASHSLEGDEESGFTLSWASAPRFRSDAQTLVACAQTLELAQAMDHYLREFAERHLLPAPAS